MGAPLENIKTAVVAGAELEYCERGEGEPLLLVHAGVFADWFLPLAASPTLDGYRIIRVRRAGYGAKVPASHLSIQDHARHLTALAQFLELDPMHVVGHSSGALIAVQMAADCAELVQSLILIEPAACGPFQVPAFAELGERFVGPAMGAFGAGDLQTAFDTFMRGVCGDHAREIIERSLGRAAYEQAVRESSFFFRDEVPAAMQWQLAASDAIVLPVLIVEGKAGRKDGPLSQQVTERATTLFPQAKIALIEGANHMVPLQEPHALGHAIASFIRRHSL